MTAREFFRTHAVDGRAVLARTAERLTAWLADVDGHLVLCRRLRDEITFVAEDAELPAVFVSGTQLPPCACWFCATYEARQRPRAA